MDPATVSLVLGGANLLGGLFGASGAARARRNAERQRQQLLSEFMIGNDRALDALRMQNARALWGLTGQGGDALQALGSRLGSAMAAAGVYNSSATAGALERSKEDLGAQLLELAARNRAAEASVAGENQRYALGQQLGFASDQVGQARADEGSYRQSIISSILGLGDTLAGMTARKPTAPASSVLPAAPITLPGQAGIQTFQLTLPGQAGIQTFQQAIRSALAVPDGRSYGPMVNGMQGVKLPVLTLRAPVRRLSLL